MSRWLKLLLTWMLVLALPMQALAAVHCGGHAAAGHPVQPDEMQPYPVHAGGAHAGHHAMAGMQHATQGHDRAGDGADAALHGAAAPADEAVSVTVATPDSPTVHAHPGLHGKCSACAACCGAVALPSAAPVLGAIGPDAAYTVASLPAPAGHVPAGDERPPRLP